MRLVFGNAQFGNVNPFEVSDYGVNVNINEDEFSFIEIILGTEVKKDDRVFI